MSMTSSTSSSSASLKAAATMSPRGGFVRSSGARMNVARKTSPAVNTSTLVRVRGDELALALLDGVEDALPAARITRVRALDRVQPGEELDVLGRTHGLDDRRRVRAVDDLGELLRAHSRKLRRGALGLGPLISRPVVALLAVVAFRLGGRLVALGLLGFGLAFRLLLALWLLLGALLTGGALHRLVHGLLAVAGLAEHTLGFLGREHMHGARVREGKRDVELLALRLHPVQHGRGLAKLLLRDRAVLEQPHDLLLGRVVRVGLGQHRPD